MGETCKGGIIRMKLQGSDRKQNRRLTANRANRVPAPDLRMKVLSSSMWTAEENRNSGGRCALANQESGL